MSTLEMRIEYQSQKQLKRSVVISTSSKLSQNRLSGRDWFRLVASRKQSHLEENVLGSINITEKTESSKGTCADFEK